MTRSVVLGAGVAGLTSAYYLQKQGEKDPLVVEKQVYPGGLAATMQWQGCRMDLGPHRIHTIYPHAKELILSLVNEELVWCPRRSQIYMDKKWLDYPPRIGEVIRRLGVIEGFLLFQSALWGKARGITNRLFRKPSGTYAHYLEYRFGKRLRQKLFDPFALKVYRESPDDLDEMVAKVRLASQGIFSVVWEALTGHNKSAVKTFLYPRYGIGLISARLTEKIDQSGGRVLLGHKAIKIRHTGGLVRSIEVEDQNGLKESFDVSRIISTIPLIDLIDMLEPKAPQNIRDTVANLTYADSILVYTLVNKQPLTANSWMYFPDDEVIFTRVFELYNFSPDLVPPGLSCLCAEIPVKPTDPIQFSDEEELKRRVWEGFQKVGMAHDVECVDQVILKIPKAYPIYREGYKDLLNEVLEYLGSLGNLISTGRHGLFHYNNSDHSMEMGRLAAEYAVQSPTDSKNWYAKRDEFDQYRIVD